MCMSFIMFNSFYMIISTFKSTAMSACVQEVGVMNAPMVIDPLPQEMDKLKGGMNKEESCHSVISSHEGHNTDANALQEEVLRGRSLSTCASLPSILQISKHKKHPDEIVEEADDAHDEKNILAAHGKRH